MTTRKMTTIVCALAILGLASCTSGRKYDGDRTTSTTTTTDRYGYNSGIPYGAAAPLQQGGYATDRSARQYDADRDARYTDRDTRYTTDADRTARAERLDRVGYRDESRARTHAYDRSQVITFSPGSAVLSEAQKNKLRTLVSGMDEDAIDRIEVAVWSDRAFPRAGTDLPKADRELADNRIKNINRFLKDDLDISGMKISTYNMAESSNWLARTFRTDDAELKSVFARDMRTPMQREDFSFIHSEGSPSKAVIVLVRDND